MQPTSVASTMATFTLSVVIVLVAVLAGARGATFAVSWLRSLITSCG